MEETSSASRDVVAFIWTSRSGYTSIGGGRTSSRWCYQARAYRQRGVKAISSSAHEVRLLLRGGAKVGRHCLRKCIVLVLDHSGFELRASGWTRAGASDPFDLIVIAERLTESGGPQVAGREIHLRSPINHSTERGRRGWSNTNFDTALGLAHRRSRWRVRRESGTTHESVPENALLISCRDSTFKRRRPRG
jgi:hypothetical protein